jgi:hypothetical protein
MQLLSSELLAQHDSPELVETDSVENSLANVDTQGYSMHERLLLRRKYRSVRLRRADHPISTGWPMVDDCGVL